MSDDPKPLHERRIWEFQGLRDICVVACILGVLWLSARLSFLTAPLLFGLGLAYLFEPVVAWLCIRVPRMNRTRAVIALVSGIILTSLLGLALVVPPLLRQSSNLADNADRYVANARAWIIAEQRPSWLRDRASAIDGLLWKIGLEKPTGAMPSPKPGPVAKADAELPVSLDEKHIRELVREQLRAPSAVSAELGGRLGDALATVGRSVVTLVGGVFSTVLFVMVAGFIAVSCMLRWPELLEMGRSLVPHRARDRILPLVSRMDATVSSFIRGRFTVAAIVGMIYAVGWTIVGVPYGLILGLAVGLFSIIPYLAAVGLPIAWLLLGLNLIAQPEDGGWYVSTGADGSLVISWWMVLILPGIVNLVAQTIEDYVLNPIIQGKATELHPVLILLAVMAGGSLAGLYGMLLAVPVAACLKILLVAEIMPRLRAWAGSEKSS